MTTTSAPTPSGSGANCSSRKLPLRRGDTVLDVGCGTGLCLPLLQHKVGPTGAIVGIDASEQMLEVAAARIAEHGWDNVRLVAAPVADAPIDVVADAAVFCAVHDVMQSPRRTGQRVRPPAPRRAGRCRRRQAAGPVDVALAGVGRRPARTVHHRLHRLRQAVAAAGRVRSRPARPRTGLRRRIHRPRPRPRPLDPDRLGFRTTTLRGDHRQHTTAPTRTALCTTERHLRPTGPTMTTPSNPPSSATRQSGGGQPTPARTRSTGRAAAATPGPRRARRAVAARRRPRASPDQQGQPSTRRSATQHRARPRRSGAVAAHDLLSDQCAASKPRLWRLTRASSNSTSSRSA